MRTVGRRLVLGAALTLAAAGVVVASSMDDDLAVVKRAVAPSSAGPKIARQEAPAVTAEPDSRPLTRRDVRWFKVRITEKGAKKARVNVNVPIALVRALGDDFPIDVGRGRWRRERDGEVRVLRLGEILATLEAGQSLVEIDDDDASVRIWIE